MRKPSKKQRLENEARKTQRLLEKVGYRPKSKPKVNRKPDLSCGSEYHRTKYPSVITFSNPSPKVESIPKGGKQFPVGHLHKQGTQLITPGEMENLQYYSGKKS